MTHLLNVTCEPCITPCTKGNLIPCFPSRVGIPDRVSNTKFTYDLRRVPAKGHIFTNSLPMTLHPMWPL